MDKGTKGALAVGAVAALGLTILMVSRGKAAPPAGLADLYGKVTDSETGDPISDVRVTLEEGIPVFTDNDGKYRILNITADYFPFGAWLYFSKVGYEPKSETVTINEGNNERNIALTPVSGPTVYTCPYCGAEFSSEEELLAHIDDEHAEPPVGEYKCSYCGETFSSFEDLVAHITSQHPGERIPIDIIWG